MRDRHRERAAQRFNAAMEEVLDRAWGGLAPTEARRFGDVHILRQDPFCIQPPRLIQIEDDGEVAVSVGLVSLDPEMQGASWSREPIRLTLQIGETGTHAPLAAATLQKSEAVRIAADLLAWLDTVAGAGGFDEAITGFRVEAALGEVLSKAADLRRTLAARNV